MLSRISTLLLAPGLCVAVFLSAHAYAITITLAEVQENDVVVAGRKAAANQEITWAGEPVTIADRRGKFSFQYDDVPDDCVGSLSDGTTTIEVELGNCEPGPGETIPELIPGPVLADAHLGDAVRAVGFTSIENVGPRVVSGGEDAYLRIWDQDLKVTGAEPLDHTVYDLATSARGSVIATGEGGWNGGTDSDTLRIWGSDGGYLHGTRAPIGYVYCVALSPHGQWTAASGFYGDIVVYDTDTLGLISTKKTKKKRTKALAFSPGGTFLASTSTAGRIQLWSFPEQCSYGSCELDLLPVSMSHSGSWSFPIAFNQNRTSDDIVEIASGSDGGMIKVWKIENFNQTPPDVSVVAVDSRAVYSLAWSPVDSIIAAGGNGDLIVYDAISLEILFQKINAHDGRINDIAFSIDGSTIVTGGDDGALKLWNFDDPN